MIDFRNIDQPQPADILTPEPELVQRIDRAMALQRAAREAERKLEEAREGRGGAK